MGKYKIEFSRKAAKDYSRLPENYKSLVDMALRKISEGIPADIKPVIGEKVLKYHSDRINRIKEDRYSVVRVLISHPETSCPSCLKEEKKDKNLKPYLDRINRIKEG